MPPTSISHRDLTAITVFLASTATPERGGLAYLDAVLPAEHRLAATRVVRDLGALPPDAILYLLAQPLLDLASDYLLRDRDLTARYEERFEFEDSDEWMAAMAEYNLTDRRAFDRRTERGRQHFLRAAERRARRRGTGPRGRSACVANRRSTRTGLSIRRCSCAPCRTRAYG